MRNIVLIFSFLLVSGCASTGSIQYVNVYPNMPKFISPEAMPLGDVVYDFSRNKDGTIDHNSNLFIGMNAASFQALMNNFNILKAREEKWQLILKSMNDDIQTWHDLNSKGKK